VRVDACRSCEARIIWALTARDKAMPVDADPVAGGNLTLTDGVPAPRVGVIKLGEQVEGDRYVSHFSTCPKAEHHRSRR
jgi:hypothetical protein